MQNIAGNKGQSVLLLLLFRQAERSVLSDFAVLPFGDKDIFGIDIERLLGVNGKDSFFLFSVFVIDFNTARQRQNAQ